MRRNVFALAARAGRTLAFGLATACLTVAGGLLSAAVAEARPAANGSTNNWFGFDQPATEVRAVITPAQDAAGYHFYALSVNFVDKTVDGQRQGIAYAGIQTNSSTNGKWIGKAFIFSLWDARNARPAGEGVISLAFSGEGNGWSLRKAYDWQAGRSYEIAIRRSGFEAEAKAYRWQAEITDLQTGTTFNLGEIIAPEGRNYIHGSNASMFHERYAGGTVCQTDAPPAEAAGARFSNLRINSHDNPELTQAIRFEPSTTNGIFADPACQDFIDLSWSPTEATTSFVIPGPSPRNGRDNVAEDTAPAPEQLGAEVHSETQQPKPNRESTDEGQGVREMSAGSGQAEGYGPESTNAGMSDLAAYGVFALLFPAAILVAAIIVLCRWKSPKGKR